MCSVDVRSSTYHAAVWETRTYYTAGATAAKIFSLGISELAKAHDYEVKIADAYYRFPSNQKDVSLEVPAGKKIRNVVIENI